MAEVLLATIATIAAFAAGRLSKSCPPTDSVSWVDGFASGYLAGMDMDRSFRIHKEGDRNYEG